MANRNPIRNIRIENKRPTTIFGEVQTRQMTPEEWDKYGPKTDKKRQTRLDHPFVKVNEKRKEATKPMEPKVSNTKKKAVKFDTQKVIELVKKHGLDDAGKKEIAKELNIYPYYIDRLVTQKRIQDALSDNKPSIKEQLVKDIAKELKLSAPKNPKQQIHMDLCAALHETYVAKNTAYGDSFSVTFQEFGIISALTRMSDKWNRIKSLTAGAKNDVRDESLDDTLLDLANYAILTVMELRR